MLLQLEIFAIALVVFFMALKMFIPKMAIDSQAHKLLGWIKNTLMPWVVRNTNLLIDLLPAAASIMMFLWSVSHFDHKSFEGFFIQTICSFVLGVVAYAFTLGMVTFTRGLINRWQGW